MAVLVRSLDDAQAAGVKVVLAPVSLPGARWKQLNGDVDDARLWRDAAFQAQAEAFWRQLAGRLRGHPAVAAYNPLNEPHPERAFGFEEPGEEGFGAWRAKAKGTPADLDAFNRRMVAAIRSADPDTPILLDGWFYASPAGLSLLEPIEAKGILYAFHFYDPWEYSTFRVNQGRWSYPERLPGPGGTAVRGGADAMRERVAPVVALGARDTAVPTSRIVAAEFGVDRRVGGAQPYLEDLVRVLNEHGWHWAFYSFRSDGDWTGLDYELGTGEGRPAHLGRREARRGPREVQAPPRQPAVAGAQTRARRPPVGPPRHPPPAVGVPEMQKARGLAAPGLRKLRFAELAGERHVRRAGPLGALRDLELDLVALVEGTEALSADLGVVNENVRTTLVRQKTKTLGLVEPLDGAFDHERTAS